MRDFFNSVRFKIIAAVLAVIVGVMLYSASTGGLATIPEKIVSFVVVPAQKASAALSDSITDFFSIFVNAKANQEENDQLKEEISELRKKMVDYENTKTENERLQEIVGLKKENPDMQLLDAGIIGRDPSDRFGSFTIDKGTVHGISKWDPVITGNGLVGYVDSLGPTYAKVVTILSPEINVGAVEIRTKETGNLTGDIVLADKGLAKLELLPKTTEVKQGDIIVTAGTSGYYPPDLVIGTIEEVTLEKSGITASASIKPVSDVYEIKHVFVLTDFLGKQDHSSRTDESEGT
ncbi:rod shape-determining protein MreC [Fumia xinanensis]|uniref:Cell shape-determining protein MreC n=1 Tax=Fumia xinanensis TaxID=2763659 RepID=A0A926I829_9FIRM|nr:rod shape-determining protein MreC [Fumia xinanensis]MBC8560492.1 rod shape-determining protein MreC [Fumia xinanensis]